MHLRRFTAAAAALLWASNAWAFSNAPLGSLIENVTLPSLGGGPAPLLGTNVSVFLFIKPGLEHSRTTLVQLAAFQKELAGKPVYWSAVVSDRIPRGEAEREVQSSGWTGSVLIDRGDALYGKLGVALYPVIGITGRDRRLLAYQPFAKVNYGAVVRARILHALGEIDDRELALTLQPPPAILGGDPSVAQRYLKLAEKQLAAGHLSQALTNVRHSLERQPGAAAWVLRGKILEAQGDRPGALASYAAALKLAPADAAAREGAGRLK